MFSAQNKIQKAFVFTGHALNYNGKIISMSSSCYKEIVAMQCIENTQWISEYPHIDGKVHNYALTEGVKYLTLLKPVMRAHSNR